MWQKIKPYVYGIALALLTGGLAGLLTKDSMAVFDSLAKPALTPPRIVFPIVWTVLYILMGISSARIYSSDNPQKKNALGIYLFQLAVNFLWSIVFFLFNEYFIAFLLLLILVLLVIIMIWRFYAIDPAAAWLQLPYLIWLLIAGYLNLSIVLLN